MKDYTGLSKKNLTAVKFVKSELGRQFYDFQCTCGIITTHRTDRVFNNNKYSIKCTCKEKQDDYPTRKALFRKYKSGAKTRGYSFDLEYDLFNELITKNCHYCGVLPSRLQKSYYKESLSFTCNGIDRKDNEIGYTISNSVSCCFICNRAKNNLDYDYFMSWINSINIKI